MPTCKPYRPPILRNPITHCSFCGNPIPIHLVGTFFGFCSSDCQNGRLSHHARYQRTWIPEENQRACLECGTSFLPPKQNVVCCNETCKRARYDRLAKERRERLKEEFAPK